MLYISFSVLLLTLSCLRTSLTNKGKASDVSFLGVLSVISVRLLAPHTHTHTIWSSSEELHSLMTARLKANTVDIYSYL